MDRVDEDTRAGAVDGQETESRAFSTQQGVWDEDSDEDDVEADLGFSPPKTMQFHVPQSRLLRTPGKFYPTPPSTLVDIVGWETEEL